eukprot:CAMPEP_0172538402 /NCGR_PEP_ID=MMETSP1067-20121228/9793_1 /TAXON_ID=265564 ORGANISM="Thalassiosira punctigera, Strain Tpunct2005C2" /NCGR_SAMPLE_ID=MMETSP1067 /ASSEMBLY_ACC=CAM_ASM_000444 /LENGTH=192 /DNA_ID=CAMNT_0013323887 /DNA_START=92 /DNA_END=670 /DNA_ORIENTATION=-
MICIVIAARLIMGGGGLASTDGANQSRFSSQQPKHCECILSAANATFSSAAYKPKPRRRTHQDDDDSVHLKVGDIVELYGDRSHFAVPAIVKGLKRENSNIKYNLLNAMTNARPFGVAPEFVHPYQVYEDGIRADCNIGAMSKIYLTPCSIVSHSINGRGFILYRVSYLDEEEGSFPEHLPFSRIQRDRRLS